MVIRRLKNRSHNVSDATEDFLPSQKLSFDTICHDEELPLIELDTTKDWKKFLRAFLAQIFHSLYKICLILLILVLVLNS